MTIDPNTGLTDSETLSYNTVRIETRTYDGQPGMGTGFLYQFRSTEDKNFNALVTNRHVLDNVQNLTIMFNRIGKDNKIDPTNEEKIELEVTELNNNWHGHPNPNIDLAFLQLDSFIDKLYRSETIPIWFFFKKGKLSITNRVEQAHSTGTYCNCRLSK